jgi:hypothetical protein
MYSLIPYSILKDGDYTRTVGGLAPGVTHLPPKEDRYRTTRGVLTLAEYNAQARAFTPTACSDDNRFLCESWLKYHHRTPEAEALYRHEQRDSRLLRDRGAGLRRADIEALRGQR